MKSEEDTVDSALFCKALNTKKVPSIEALNSEMPCKQLQKERGRKMIKSFLNRLRLKKCATITISKPDPSYRVAYLGNVVTGWAKGDGCVEKPLATLWRNYTQSSRPDVRMQLTVSPGGLKATTKDHGLTEYWAHRLTSCSAPERFPRLFCWVYRHEGRRLRHELRCHAVLCPTTAVARQIEGELRHALSLALAEFKRDKISRQNARLSLVNSVYENPTIPRRKILLSTGSQNYRPPLERSKSAPKLTAIEEIIEEEEDDYVKPNAMVYKKILRHYDSTSALLDKRKKYVRRLHYQKSREDGADPPVIAELAEIAEKSADEEKRDLILDELVQDSLRNDLLETCERAWFSALGETHSDLMMIPPDSDEGSLSSGCESASTVTSDSDQLIFPAIAEEDNSLMVVDSSSKVRSHKTDLDFKVGGCVLARVRSFERINSDILKYCGLNNNSTNNSNSKSLLGGEEVSLIPVGESQSDFSSLKVFKKRIVSSSVNAAESVGNKSLEVNSNGEIVSLDDGGNSEGENESACSDESGYDEEEEIISSSVANIVLV